MALLAAMVAAHAEEPTVSLQNHFVALQVLLGDLGRDIAAAHAQLATTSAQATAAAQAEERLKWVLDHPEWLGAPATAAKR